MATRGVAPIEVMAAMMREQVYQDAKGYSSVHTVPAWLLIMRSELAEAEQAWVKGAGDQDALREVLQVITVGMRCLMDHGVVERRLTDA